MPQREGADDGGMMYRSPVTQAAEPPKYTADEANYDTIKQIGQDLERELNALYKDFNTFQIAKDMDPDERAKILLHEVEVKQGVYDILVPIIDRIHSSLKTADDNFKQRNQAS